MDPIPYPVQVDLASQLSDFRIARDQVDDLLGHEILDILR
jgi:hypothetical protein